MAKNVRLNWIPRTGQNSVKVIWVGPKSGSEYQSFLTLKRDVRQGAKTLNYTVSNIENGVMVSGIPNPRNTYSTNTRLFSNTGSGERVDVTGARRKLDPIINPSQSSTCILS